jgi:hypothetical protein
MPIREFKCPDGHVTERILHGESDKTLNEIECEQVLGRTTRHFCGKPAKRIEISTTGTPRLKAGCGGFYSPNA